MRNINKLNNIIDQWFYDTSTSKNQIAKYFVIIRSNIEHSLGIKGFHSGLSIKNDLNEMNEIMNIH